MSKPSYEEMKSGVVKWRDRVKSVIVEVSWHGYNEEHSPDGIWCYYIYIDKKVFSKDWHLLEPTLNPNGHWVPNNALHELDFHGGITFCEREYGNIIKVGCDFNHYYDLEFKSSYNLAMIMSKAKATAEQLLEQYPDYNIRCAWSGKWDHKENFYKAVNGNFIHNDQEDLIPEQYVGYRPEDIAE